MKIIKYEFITNDYPRDNKWIHWSRVYEWTYVLNYLKDKNPKNIHNTACGGLNTGDCLHLTFCSDLDSICDYAMHSDLWGNGYKGTDVAPAGKNFGLYDITKPCNRSYDYVLNISTLEHLPKDKIETTFHNLWNQVNDGGELILTCDYPDIDIETTNKLLNSTCKIPNDAISNGNLKVLLIHLKK